MLQRTKTALYHKSAKNGSKTSKISLRWQRPSIQKADKYNRPAYLVAIDEAVKNCHAKSFGFDLSKFMERNCDDNPAMELDNREGAIAWRNVMEGGC